MIAVRVALPYRVWLRSSMMLSDKRFHGLQRYPGMRAIQPYWFPPQPPEPGTAPLANNKPMGLKAVWQGKFLFWFGRSALGEILDATLALWLGNWARKRLSGSGIDRARQRGVCWLGRFRLKRTLDYLVRTSTEYKKLVPASLTPEITMKTFLWPVTYRCYFNIAKSNLKHHGNFLRQVVFGKSRLTLGTFLRRIVLGYNLKCIAQPCKERQWGLFLSNCFGLSLMIHNLCREIVTACKDFKEAKQGSFPGQSVVPSEQVILSPLVSIVKFIGGWEMGTYGNFVGKTLLPRKWPGFCGGIALGSLLSAFWHCAFSKLSINKKHYSNRLSPFNEHFHRCFQL